MRVFILKWPAFSLMTEMSIRIFEVINYSPGGIVYVRSTISNKGSTAVSKRSNFEKIPKDFYSTIDPKAIPTAILPYIKGKTYAEPCYGVGDLEDLLMDVATCKWRSDVRETVGASKQMDAMSLTKKGLEGCDLIITNPPFSRDVLLPLIDHFIGIKPTWLLLPADLAHNGYFKPYMGRCSRVISVGRLYWFKNEWVDKDWIDCYGWGDEPWFTSRLGKRNHTLGRVEYTGWWDTTNDKPAKSEFVRGTDNYCWYFWPQGSRGCDTMFLTNGG